MRFFNFGRILKTKIMPKDLSIFFIEIKALNFGTTVTYGLTESMR